jgi:phosphatidylserine/phosphatidylglycerophosphate/cardiolipin synthase-like enzyme
VDEKMKLVLNSGPDSGWEQLSNFFARTRKRITATMFEFTARHIFDGLVAALPAPRKLDFVMDWEAEGDFSNDEIADKLREELGSRFKFAWAPVQSDNVTTKSWIRSSYHIKVAVRDGGELWLSSGNWKPSSQPEQSPKDLTTSQQRLQLQSRHNRDWHILVENKSLAELFETYVRHDLKQASAVQRTTAAALARRQPDVWVPLDDLAALDVDEPTFFPAKTISGRVKIQPLLTPDNFIDYILPLVRGAQRRLYLENQALKGGRAGSPHGDLHRAVAEKTRDRQMRDVKIILREEYDMEGMFTQLQAAGADMTKVRFLRGVHTKGIIVDDTAVVIGSHNLTSQGVKENRDASLIVYDKRVMAFYEKLFLYDWGRAKPGRARSRSPRLAVPGQAPPPGMVRMRWSEFMDA